MMGKLLAYANRRLERTVRHALNGLYPPERGRLRGVLAHPLGLLLSWLAARKNRIYHLVVLTGTPPGQNNPIRMLYAGREDPQWDQTLHYIAHQVFGDVQPDAGQRITCTARELRRTVGRMSAGCDLVFAEANRTLMWQPRRGDWVITPPWVRMVFDFQPGESWQQVKKRFQSQKENVRLVRRAGFDIRLSRSDGDLEYFYDRMYLPLIRSRHRDWVYVNALKSMREWLARGDLMFVVDRTGRSVAGFLNLYQGRVNMVMLNGVLDADPDLLRQGALSAIYFFSIRWSFDNGYTRCDFGETRPFTNDGIYLHKIRWGLKMVEDPWRVYDWLFWAPDGSAWGLNWLKNQPFIPGFARKNGDWTFRTPETKPQQGSQPVTKTRQAQPVGDIALK